MNCMYFLISIYTIYTYKLGGWSESKSNFIVWRCTTNDCIDLLHSPDGSVAENEKDGTTQMQSCLFNLFSVFSGKRLRKQKTGDKSFCTKIGLATDAVHWPLCTTTTCAITFVTPCTNHNPLYVLCGTIYLKCHTVQRSLTNEGNYSHLGWKRTSHLKLRRCHSSIQITADVFSADLIEFAMLSS